MPENASPLLLSVLTAAISLVFVLPAGAVLAWLLVHHSRPATRTVLEAVVSLPLVLPPTAVGYGLLMFLGNGTAFGRWLNGTAGVHLLFTWQGAAIAAGIMSFPLFMRSAIAAFASIESEFLSAARVMGASDAAVFFHIGVPLAFRGMLAGTLLAFARAIGEFGATIIVAGSIPGRTRTMPLALYSAIEEGDNRAALHYALILLALGAAIVAVLGAVERRVARLRGER